MANIQFQDVSKQRKYTVKSALLTMKPTSVEPERAFSAMGLFITKLRNRLNDDNIDSLIFMRQYYKNKNCI